MSRTKRNYARWVKWEKIFPNFHPGRDGHSRHANLNGRDLGKRLGYLPSDNAWNRGKKWIKNWATKARRRFVKQAVHQSEES